jgi:hypothetical protein
MSKIESRISTSSEEFKANTAAMQQVVEDWRDKYITISEGGSEKHAISIPPVVKCSPVIVFRI